VFDAEDFKEVPLIGHPVHALTRGFSNVGRWLQLAPRAVADLCFSGSLPTPRKNPGFWERTRCVVALPVLDERFAPDPRCLNGAIESSFLSPFGEAVHELMAPSQISLHPRGRSGVFECLTTARKWIERREAERVIVVSVDSLVDASALGWLMEDDRLKTDENAVGLVPGEAGAAVLLEDPAAATARGARVLAQLGGVATAGEPQSFRDGHLPSGRALAKVIEELRGALGAKETMAGLLISDLNGESWRAHELGCAQAAVSHIAWDRFQLVLPVRSTGDAGTATAGIQLAVACQALSRAYAGGGHILVICSDEHGSVGGAVLQG